MHDDGVDLVTLNHADIEEPGIFGVQRAVHWRAVAVAMVLRRLHHADARVGEQRHQILEPGWIDGVVGVDDADDLRIRRGVRQRQPQGAGLVTGELFHPDEFEAVAEHTAMLFDRPPQRRIGSVVDDQDAFEIGVVEPRHGIERRRQHRRRFVAGRDVDRHLRDEDLGNERRSAGKTARRPAEGDGGDLVDARERDDDERHQEQDAQSEREGGARHEVSAPSRTPRWPRTTRRPRR